MIFGNDDDKEREVISTDGKRTKVTMDEGFYNRENNRAFLKFARPDLSDEEVDKIMDDFERTHPEHCRMQ
jgi:phage gp16-like protein